MVDPLVEEDMTAQTLFHDELAVICGKHNRWSRQRSVKLSELVDGPWALLPPSSFLEVLTRDTFAHGLEVPRVTVLTRSTQ